MEPTPELQGTSDEEMKTGMTGERKWDGDGQQPIRVMHSKKTKRETAGRGTGPLRAGPHDLVGFFLLEFPHNEYVKKKKKKKNTG